MNGVKYSFWQATNRHAMSPQLIKKAQQSYDYNFSAMLPKFKEAKIVELGCSEGIALEWLAKHGYTNLAAVDADGLAIGLARERLTGAIPVGNIVAGDALEFVSKTDNNSVYLVLMFNIIEHLPKEVILRLIPEIRRVLVSGGKLIVQTGNVENPLNYGLFARDFTHEISFTSNSLRQLMIMSGYDQKNVTISPLRYRLTPKSFPLRITQKVFGFLLKTWAYGMRIRIDETAPMIYCVARK